MQLRKSATEVVHPLPGLPLADGDDPRERLAPNAARPSAPQPPSGRLASPFRVKPSSSYLERRSWPFCGL